MSWRGSLRYHAIGTYSRGTECDWHVYHDGRDDTYHLEITLLSRKVLNVQLPYWVVRWLP